MSAKKSAKPKKQGLYANIHAKQKRISAGSGETMNQPGEKDAPTDESFSKAKKDRPQNVAKSISDKR